MARKPSKGDLLIHHSQPHEIPSHNVWAYSPAYSPDGNPIINTDGNTARAHAYATLAPGALGIYIGRVLRQRPDGSIATHRLIYVYGLDVCVHLSDNWHRVD